MIESRSPRSKVVQHLNHIFNKMGYQENIFSYSSMKTYVVSTHWKRLGEALPMSTTTCFRGGIRKNINNFWLKNAMLNL